MKFVAYFFAGFFLVAVGIYLGRLTCARRVVFSFCQLSVNTEIDQTKETT